MRMFRDTRTITSTLLLAAAGVLVAGSASADPSNLKRLSAEFQNSTSTGLIAGEITTSAAAAPAGAGGMVVYDKALAIPDDLDVLYITFSGQGETHQGSALLMNATVNGVLCEPLVEPPQQRSPHVQTGWYTLLHLPQSTTGTNCNDGSGGTADCHDNNLIFSCCARVESSAARVQIKLANLPGGDGNFSTYERSTIYIDGQKDEPEGSTQLCRGVGTGPH